ncbi:MAG TPA: phage tail protein [Candidatus Binataceae bacterium]|nr:phage tail protein [Candidatus Binataceae bacterium]
MFAVLGDIPFQVVGSPESLSDSRGYDYAEHRVVQDRPVLQWLADELETIQLEMLLHQSFTNPTVNLLLLLQAAETHAALPLVFGNGYFRGYFVIARIDTVSKQLSGTGDLFAITVRLSLRESPVSFDPTAPAIPSFVPIGIVAAATSSTSAATTPPNTGVSAILGPVAPTAPITPDIRPDDVSVSAIVRSV